MRSASWARARSPFRRVAGLQGGDGARDDREGHRHVVVRGQGARHGRRAGAAHRCDDSDPQWVFGPAGALGFLIGEEGGEAGDRRGRALAEEGDRDGVDVAARSGVGGAPEHHRGAAGRTSPGPRRRDRCRVRVVAQDRDAGGRRSARLGGGDGDVGDVPEDRLLGKPAGRLLELRPVDDAAVEGEAHVEHVGRTRDRPHPDRDVEPRLGRRDPRGLRDQGEGRGVNRTRAGHRGGARHAEEGSRGHRERAEGGPGPARRHRERLEGALPWAGAVHVGSRTVPPLCQRHRGGGAAFRRGRAHALSGGRIGARRTVLGRGRTDSTDSDVDLTTDARPDETERLVRGWADDVWTQGARFGTIGARKDTVVYEITTHRAEVYVPESRKPEVTFGDDIAVDLSRTRLHDQRTGAAPARHGADRPLRRAE